MKSVVPTYSQKCFLGLLMLLVAKRTKLGRLLASINSYAASAVSLNMSGCVDDRALSSARFRIAGLMFNSDELPGVRKRAITSSTSLRRGWIDEPNDCNDDKLVYH
jgi:hypothetical protein